MSFKWTCPGTNCVKEFAIAMIGLPKSPSLTPVARQRARAPAMLRPWVASGSNKRAWVWPWAEEEIYRKRSYLAN